MFTIFISIALSFALNLFHGYSVALDTCQNVYYDSNTDCMVSVMEDNNGATYEISDYCAGRGAKAIVISCNGCSEVVYAVTFTEFIH